MIDQDLGDNDSWCGPDEEIELETCYRWSCRGCGHVNLVDHYIIELEPSDEEKQTMAHAETEGVDVMGVYQAGPAVKGDQLACIKCEKIHKLKPPPPLLDYGE